MGSSTRRRTPGGWVGGVGKVEPRVVARGSCGWMDSWRNSAAGLAPELALLLVVVRFADALATHPAAGVGVVSGVLLLERFPELLLQIVCRLAGLVAHTVSFTNRQAYRPHANRGSAGPRVVFPSPSRGSAGPRVGFPPRPRRTSRLPTVLGLRYDAVQVVLVRVVEAVPVHPLEEVVVLLAGLYRFATPHAHLLTHTAQAISSAENPPRRRAPRC